MKSGIVMTLTLAAAAVASLSLTEGADAAGKGRGTGPVVYVTSQDLFYDSIVIADPVPARGPFQELRMGPNGLETDYGPGNTHYVGGRWAEDIDGDGDVHYFVCPLLGPGRTSP